MSKENVKKFYEVLSTDKGLGEKVIAMNKKLEGLQPGSFSVYCNDGFTLAELIVEKVSGKSFSEFIKDYITLPLGLSNTKTPQDNVYLNRLAKTYSGEIETPSETFNMIGSGGIYSTAEDLCRFGEIFIKNKQNVEKDNFLTVESKAATMQKEYKKGLWPAQIESTIGYGLGWDSVDAFPFNQYQIQALKKGGDTDLYHSSLIVLPEQNMVVAIVSSGGSSMFADLIGQSILLQTLIAEGKISGILPPVSYQKPIATNVPKEALENSGFYADSSLVASAEINEEGTLSLSVLTKSGIPSEIYKYTAKGEFVNLEGNKNLTFVKESNDHTYIRIVYYIDVPELGQTAATYYYAQKITPVSAEASIQQAWDKRTQTVYYLVNEKYTSQCYNSYENSIFKLNVNENLPGYVSNFKILNQNQATNMEIQVPGIGGRDTSTLDIINKDNKEYLVNSGYVYQDANDISNIYTNGDAICTINSDGYARWYKIDEDSVGKTIMVKLPNKASFAVYEGENCIYYSTVFGNQPVKLPKNGRIVFVGDVPGAKFEISYK